MAKKSKNIKVDDTELKPTILGEVTGLKRNPALLIVMFLIFLSVIYFMPEINRLLKKESYESNITPDIILDEDKEKEDEVIVDNNTFDYKENMSIDYEDLKFKKIVYENNILSFSLSAEGSLDLKNQNYFLEVYSTNNTLVKRIMLEKIRLYKDIYEDYKYDFVIDSISHFKVKNILKSEYPNVSLEKDVDNKSSLTCTSGSIFTYYFLDDKLYLVKEEVHNSESDLKAKYANVTGITVVGYDDYTITYDLEEMRNADIINNKYVYSKDETPTIIKFELEANNFKCE